METRKRFILDRAFDAFIIRLNEGLQGCHYARSNKDYVAWYKAICNVYSELSAFIKDAQKDSRLQELKNLNDKLTEVYWGNETFWQLYEMEIFLHHIIEKEKLQEKKGAYDNDATFI